MEASAEMESTLPLSGVATIEFNASGDLTVVAQSAFMSGFAAPAEVSITSPVTWESAATGYVQQRLEEVLTHLDRAELLAVLGNDDRLTLEGIRELLDRLQHTEETPDKSLVIGPLKWLGRKVDKFVDAAAESAGKVAGPVLLAAAVSYITPLRHVVGELIQLAESSPN